MTAPQRVTRVQHLRRLARDGTRRTRRVSRRTSANSVRGPQHQRRVPGVHRDRSYALRLAQPGWRTADDLRLAAAWQAALADETDLVVPTAGRCSIRRHVGHRVGRRDGPGPVGDAGSVDARWSARPPPHHRQREPVRRPLRGDARPRPRLATTGPPLTASRVRGNAEPRRTRRVGRDRLQPSEAPNATSTSSGRRPSSPSSPTPRSIRPTARSSIAICTTTT